MRQSMLLSMLQACHGWRVCLVRISPLSAPWPLSLGTGCLMILVVRSCRLVKWVYVRYWFLCSKQHMQFQSTSVTNAIATSSDHHQNQWQCSLELWNHALLLVGGQSLQTHKGVLTVMSHWSQTSRPMGSCLCCWWCGVGAGCFVLLKEPLHRVQYLVWSRLLCNVPFFDPKHKLVWIGQFANMAHEYQGHQEPHLQLVFTVMQKPHETIQIFLMLFWPKILVSNSYNSGPHYLGIQPICPSRLSTVPGVFGRVA
jgi:hypothetical protein